MTKKQLWQQFMKTGKISDYLKYKSAPDDDGDYVPYPDEEISRELTEEFINNYDSDFPAAEEFEHDNKNTRFGDS